MVIYARKILLLVLLLAFFISGKSQPKTNYDSLINAILSEDSILLDEMSSSASFMNLLDSIINYDYRYSSLSFSVGYISDITNAGRNFGISQYGFGSSISYYHKSGVFGDISGYWNSESSPPYNPTILSAGYMNALSPKWSFILNYDYYWYQDAETETDLSISYPLTHSLNGALYFDFKPFTAGTEYSFLFGDETAHRIRSNLMGNIKFKDIGFLDKISILPNASILLGDQTLYAFSQSYQIERDALYTDLINQYGLRTLLRFRRRNPEAFRQLLLEKSSDYTYVVTNETSENVFGIMNYSFSVPVAFTYNNLSLSISYTLNFPVALPGEDIDYDPNSYFNTSLMYNLPFRKN